MIVYDTHGFQSAYVFRLHCTPWHKYAILPLHQWAFRLFLVFYKYTSEAINIPAHHLWGLIVLLFLEGRQWFEQLSPFSFWLMNRYLCPLDFPPRASPMSLSVQWQESSYLSQDCSEGGIQLGQSSNFEVVCKNLYSSTWLLLPFKALTYSPNWSID